MLQGQPKGLFALALANTGERFGYYTMLAIFTLFLQAKFGYSAAETSTIFASFLAFVYFTPLIGGMLADKFGYGKMVTSGIIIMFVGYMLLAIPTGAETGKALMFGSLALIACGTGLFKGNLQVMVGNLYDAPEYKSKRDQAFSIFYMAINIGAMYAPTAATKMTDWMLAKYNFFYESQIPSLAHQFLNGTISAENKEVLAGLQAAQHYTGDMASFCNAYIERLSEAYNYGFGVACVSLIISMAIYTAFRSTFKHADVNTKQAQAATTTNTHQEELSPAETKQRIVALLLVFAVVLFFWMAFHQNGLTMTFFARDYTANQATGLDRLGFDVLNLTFLVVAIYGAFSIFQSQKKLISIIVTVVALVALGINYMSMPETMTILPQQFQQFNPFFVVALTPVSLAIFGYLANKKKEPSAPRKIGTGMLIAACGFLILAIGSMGLPTPDALAADSKLQVLVSPNWLISTYLVLTFAELLLSPMGISFVSKVAPPKYKGAMMGGWFVATAIGNYMVAIIGYLWGGMELWMVWSVLIVLCLLSALFMFSIMKKLEKVAK
ncbi:peptide MFS transporter [Parabacteroides chinchillae]|uniref:Proton-dependent oligopeptide transporter, POT family n=1 Tax=Parabacteroides chinchillae TaxID=871327 RepID=A0A8G2BXF3_9BACT|nr:peptide MFS transporter [Parabacteroides chinchillae]SEG04072.1 proton-dependent oligopeptide transporter, POT family [Parabacteroides chinchillae]